jgi:hypothetical protein
VGPSQYPNTNVLGKLEAEYRYNCEVIIMEYLPVILSLQEGRPEILKGALEIPSLHVIL